METFKRNQIEEAISRLIGETGPPSTWLRARIKRLLDLDRKVEKKPRSKQATFAFYTDASPGTGVEVQFTNYEAFAIYVGLNLMRHGWSQKFVVEVLRDQRRALEAEHARTLKLDPKDLFDFEKIKKNAKPGQLTPLTTDPVYLVLASTQEMKDGKETAVSSFVCRGFDKLNELARSEQSSQSWSFIELVRWAHKLSEELKRSEPRKRGRT